MNIRANILVDTIALVVALIALKGDYKWEERGAYHPRFRLLLISISLILFMDMLAWACEGRIFPGARVLSLMINTLCYAMQIVCCWLWMLYSFNWTRDFKPIPMLWKLLFALPFLFELGALIYNLFMGSVFYIDGDNHYRRGANYIINLIPFALYTITALLILSRAWFIAKDTNRKRHCVGLIASTFLPTCGTIIETQNYDMMLTWPLAALALLLICLSAQQEQNAVDQAEAASAKAELAQSRVSIMLSQIQPHFLYNSLTVISELCATDPEKARYATIQFSAFLRGNMNSLTMNKPIAFEHELRHTQNYLALERLRFPDRLRTVFEIKTTSFFLPTLTLQPIVENAVRYGVTKRPEGGTVIIRSEETQTAFIVTVSDDGVGFDPMLLKDDGRTHIGISNVSDRLHRMVGGTLEISSVPDQGTVAVITIPKGETPC